MRPSTQLLSLRSYLLLTSILLAASNPFFEAASMRSSLYSPSPPPSFPTSKSATRSQSGSRLLRQLLKCILRSTTGLALFEYINSSFANLPQGPKAVHGAATSPRLEHRGDASTFPHAAKNIVLISHDSDRFLPWNLPLLTQSPSGRSIRSTDKKKGRLADDGERRAKSVHGRRV